MSTDPLFLSCLHMQLLPTNYEVGVVDFHMQIPNPGTPSFTCAEGPDGSGAPGPWVLQSLPS